MNIIPILIAVALACIALTGLIGFWTVVAVNVPALKEIDKRINEWYRSNHPRSSRIIVGILLGFLTIVALAAHSVGG